MLPRDDEAAPAPPPLPLPDTPPPVLPGSDVGSWRPPTPFEHCISLQVVDASGSFPDSGLCCVVRSDGIAVEQFPVRAKDDEADCADLCERVDLLSSAMVQEVQLLLRTTSRGVLDRAQLIGDLRLGLGSLWAEDTPDAFDGWLALRSSSGRDAFQRQSFSSLPAEQSRMLRVRVRCFRPARLHEAAGRRAVFERYAEREPHLTLEQFEQLVSDLTSSGTAAFDGSGGGTGGEAGFGGGAAAAGPSQPSCLGSCLGWFGLYRPEESMLRYLGYYHTLLWVMCQAPGERRVSIADRIYFVGLSMAFNLFVVVLFSATDCSLVFLNCPKPDSCSPLQQSLWNAAQVALVALIDIMFWPLLKMAFFFFYDERHSGKLRHAILVTAAVFAGATLLWVLISSWSHAQEVQACFYEFLSTWPAARVTEAFKLMSLWGLLIEYGAPEPPTELVTCEPPPRAAAAAAAGQAEDKRVPLLSAQH